MDEDKVAELATEWAELLSDLGGFRTDYNGQHDLDLCRRAARQAGVLLQRPVQVEAQDGIVSIWLSEDSHETQQANYMIGQAETSVQVGKADTVNVYRHGSEPTESATDQPPIIVTAKTGNSPLISSQLYFDLVNISPSQLRESEYSHEQLVSNYEEMTRGITDNNVLALTVEGRVARAVILDAVRIRILDRRAGGTPHGILVRTASAPYAMKVSNFLADLRTGDTVIPTPLPQQHDRGELTADFPYAVHSTEPERLNIHLYYEDQDIEWIAELDWTFGGRSGKLRIDNSGAPFISTPFCTRPAYKWDGTGKGWQRDEDAWPRWMQQWIDQYSGGDPVESRKQRRWLQMALMALRK